MHVIHFMNSMKPLWTDESMYLSGFRIKINESNSILHHPMDLRSISENPLHVLSDVKT